MSRRRFDHFYRELCCAEDRRIARYALWLEVCDRGLSPENLGREALLLFFDRHLPAFLAHDGSRMTDPARRQLRRTLERYDPRHPTPYEVMERISAPRSNETV